MRHGCKKGKLNRTDSHRYAMIRNMTISIFANPNKMIKTSLVNAKVLRRYIEPLITFTKNNIDNKDRKLSMIRYLLSKVYGNIDTVYKIIECAKIYKDRPGGYTRIIKCGYRNNDRMALAIMQFV